MLSLYLILTAQILALDDSECAEVWRCGGLERV